MNDKIKAIGCFFKSCVAVAELETGIYLTANQHNTLWDIMIVKGAISDKDDIQNSAAIITAAFTLCNCKKRAIEVSTDGVFYHWILNNPKYKRIDYRIEKILQGGKSKTHFRLVNEVNKVIFEPHIPDIKSLGHVYTIGYFIEEV